MFLFSQIPYLLGGNKLNWSCHRLTLSSIEMAIPMKQWNIICYLDVNLLFICLFVRLRYYFIYFFVKRSQHIRCHLLMDLPKVCTNTSKNGETNMRTKPSGKRRRFAGHAGGLLEVLYRPSAQTAQGGPLLFARGLHSTRQVKITRRYFEFINILLFSLLLTVWAAR